MDLLKLFRLFFRHKVVTLLVSALVVAGVVWTYTSAPPVYRAEGSVVLLYPPAPPSQGTEAVPGQQNPFSHFDISVVVDVLVRVMTQADVRQEIQDKGLVGTYTIGANVDFSRGPIVDIAAEAPTGDDAMASVRLVMKEVDAKLAAFQSNEGTDPSYQIHTSTVVEPERATTVFSSALRRLISVGALGGLLIVGSVLLADVLTTRRRRGVHVAAEREDQAPDHLLGEVGHQPPPVPAQPDVRRPAASVAAPAAAPAAPDVEADPRIHRTGPLVGAGAMGHPSAEHEARPARAAGDDDTSWTPTMPARIRPYLRAVRDADAERNEADGTEDPTDPVSRRELG